MRVRGFTLVELMIAVAIVAIVAAIAYPSYLGFVARGNRSQGEQFLMDLAQTQERYRLDQGQYAAAAALTALGVIPPPPVAKYYTLPAPYIAAAGLPFFAAELTPIAGTLQADDGRLIINSRGETWREMSPGCILGTGCSPTSSSAAAWN